MIYINIHPINRLGLQRLHWLLIVFAFAVPAGVWAQGVGNDAALSQLSLIESSNIVSGNIVSGNAITLTPTFSPDQTNYEAIVPSNIAIVTVTAGVRDSGASLIISPQDIASTSLFPGHQVDVAQGETNIVVTVTAEDGVTTRTYTVRLIYTKVTLVVTPSRINADGGAATVTATMSHPQTAQQIEVAVAAEAVPPATNATFTVNNSPILTFPLNTTTSTGTVTITGVNTNSGMLEHVVRISGTSSTIRVLIVNEPILTIVDYDQRVILKLNPTTVAENAGQTTVAVTAMLDGSATYSIPTTVTVSVAGGTAIAGTDFTAVPDFTVTIPANMQSGSESFLLNPSDDDDHEVAETLIVSGAATGLSVIEATLQLIDNDPLSIDAALSQLSLIESGDINGNIISGNAITLTPTFSPNQTSYEVILPSNIAIVTVTAEVRDSDASLIISPQDITPHSSFPGHQVGVVQGEDIVVTVTAEDGMTTRIYTVQLIYAKVTLVVTPSRINADGGVATVTATMSHPQTAQQVEVAVAAEAAPPATNATFTVSNPRTLTFPLNTTTSTGTVTITGVNTNSGMLEHVVRISGTTGAIAVLIVNEPILTIEEDQRAILELNPTTVAENAGQTTVAVTAILKGPTYSTPTTVTVSVAGGTAIAGTDFIAVPDFTVTIPANMQSGSGSFLLNPLDDDDDEAAEKLIVSGAATGLNIIRATLELIDDDPPRVLIQAVNPAVEEGNPATFNLSRGSHHLNEELVVNITVTEHGDFIDGTPPTTVTFASGNTVATLSVPTEDDQYIERTSATHRIYHPEALENDGSVTATIAQGTGYLPAIGSSSSATVQVEENDLPLITMRPDPSIIGSVPHWGDILEGEEFAIYIDRTGNDEARLDVSFRLSAVCSGEDPRNYTPNAWPFSSGASGVGVESAVLESGLSTVRYALSTVDENIFDCDVLVTATSISSPSYYNDVGSSSPGTPTSAYAQALVLVFVRNNDAQPTLTIADAEANEGDGTISFTATLSGSRHARPLDIAWEATSTVNDMHGTATMGEDYGRDARGVLSFDALEQGSREFTVPIIDDVTDEENETFFIDAAYNDQTATGTIIDDDATSTRITLSVSPRQVREYAGATPVTVTATLNEGARTEATTVTVSVSGGTASSTDFAPVGAITLTIAANQTSGEATFTLSPVNDEIDDNDETVTVSGTTTAIGLTVPGTEVTITDDDTRGVTVTPTILVIDEGGSDEYTVVLTSQPTAAVTVSVTRSGDDDITVNKSSLTFTASNWNTAQTVMVSAAEDGDAAAGTATITHGVTSSGDYSGETASPVSVTERDNDSASTIVTLSVSPNEVSESSSGQVVTVTGTLNGGTRGGATTVSVSVSGGTAIAGTGGFIALGTAIAGTDFTAVPDFTVIIPANMQSGSGSFLLNPLDDDDDEDAEKLIVSGATTGLRVIEATLELIDDDPPRVSIQAVNPAVEEGNPATFNLSRGSHHLNEELVVNITVTEHGDFIDGTPPTTVTFASGNTVATLSVPTEDDQYIERTSATHRIYHPEALENDGSVTATIAQGTGYLPAIGSSSSATVQVEENDLPLITMRPDPSILSSVRRDVGNILEGQEFAIYIDRTGNDEARLDVSFRLSAVCSGEESGSYTPNEWPFSSGASGVGVESAVLESGLSTVRYALSTVDENIHDCHVLVTATSIASLDFYSTFGFTNPGIPTNTSLPAAAQVLVRNNDGQPTLTITDAEANEDNGTISFTATLSGSRHARPLDIAWEATSTVNSMHGTATMGEDYGRDARGVLSFDALEHGSREFTVPIIDDVTDEENETFFIDTAYNNQTATGTIIDDDATSTRITLSVSLRHLWEYAGATPVAIRATLNEGARTEATTVTVSVSGGTASSTDFAPVGAITLTIGANQTSGTATFTLSPVNDAIAENDETILVSGTTAIGLTVEGIEIMITDDDTPSTTVTLRVSPDEVSESSSGQVVTVTGTLNGSTRGDATTVSVSVSGGTAIAGTGGFIALGTAIAGTDFTAVPDFTVIIPANMQSGSGSFLLNPLDDDDDEDAEKLIVSGATTGLRVIEATLELIDDDPPRVSIQAVNPAVEEGNPATFNLSRGSHHLNEELVVNITVTEHGDFIDGTPPTTVTFASGNTVATLSVPTEDDQYIERTSATHRIYHPEALENDGSVTATIAQGTGYLPAIGSSSSATVQVEENDLPLITMRPDPSILSSVRRDVGNILEGQEFAIYIDRTGNDEARLDVSFRLSAVCSGEESGSYTPNEWPFSSGASGVGVESAVLESGLSTVRYALSTVDENIHDCHVLVTATSIASLDFYSTFGFTNPGIPTNTSEKAAAQVLVRNNDGQPELTIADTEANEGDGTISFTATLSGSRHARPLDIAWEATSTVNSMHGTATMGEDYGRDARGVLSFDALEHGSREFTVPIIDDVTDEENETFFIDAAYNNQTATGTIIDDDATSTRITLSVSPRQVREDAGATPVTVTATLNESARTEATTVTVSVSGGTASSTDFAPVGAITLTIGANQTSGTATFTLSPVNDEIVENDETILVSGTTAAGLSVTPTEVTITDDDNDIPSTTVTLRVSPDEVSESSSGQVVTVTGTLNRGMRSDATTVSVSVGSGTAISGTDFAAVGAITLTIAANQVSGEATFTLSPVNDAIDEDNETVSVRGTTTATGLGITSTQMTITDDDDRGVTVTPTTLSVGEGGSEEYTVVLTSQPTAAVTVSVTKSGDDDITVNKTSLTFTASNWNTAQTVTVNAAEDGDAAAGTATITHGVTSSSDYSGETASPVSVTERDNDPASTIVTLSASPDEVSESNTGQIVTVTGTLNGGTRADETTVSVSITDLSTVGAITLTIGANQTSGTATFTLSPVNDAIDENDETVTVSGTTTAIGLSIISTSVTIIDDDTRGVTVTPTTLSVGEGESEEYTVVLTSQPTAAVTVSVTKSGDSDITVNKASLTFTASNWNTAQTVMVSAAEDDDAAAGTATITHSVTSSGDYSGETASPVNVTERDNDSASTIVTLRVSPDEVSENSSGQVVTVTGTLNGGTRGDATTVSVSVGSGTATSGTDFAPVGAITLTIAANQTSGTATFTLSPVNDAIDEDNETVSVSGTTTAIGLSITSTQVTITDDDTRGVTVTPTILTIDEGSSEEYTVVLTSQPTAAVTVSVTKSGDDDITVNKASLTFTASNWNTAQTVTVNAAEDGDAAAGTATITHGVTSSSDYSSETASPVSVTERDNDSASTIVTLRVSPDEVSESSSGQVVTVTGTLNGGTRANETTVSVSIGSGTATSGTDFAIVGAITLTIGANQTSGTATFTLSPVNDAIDENDETVSVSGATSAIGLSITSTQVTIEDDDTRGVTVTPTRLEIDEGGSETYTVVLTSQPTEAVTVSVTKSGDSDITVNKPSLTFTASNWNTAQTVTVNATEDTDAAAGTATISHGVTSSGDYSGETAASVSVTERDNDSASTIVTLSVSPDEVSESSSDVTVTVTGTLNGGTRANETTVSVSIGSGTATSVTDFATVGVITLTIAANQASGNATFTLSPVNDAIDENNETVSVSGTTTATGLTVEGTEITITDDDTRGVTVTPPTLSVGEGDSEEYTVVLTSQPTAAVTVSVTKSGDTDVTVNKFSLIFTTSNWNTAQTVTVSAAEDNDAAAGTATISHGVTSSGDYSGETASSVSVTERDNDSASTIVTLSVSPGEVSENSSGQVVTVTGTLNGGTRGDATTVTVTIAGGTASSTDFTAISPVTVTIAAGDQRGEATFTLNPVNDAIDENDETVSVSGMTSGLNVTSTSVTITDDDDRGVTVTPTTLSVGEGASEEYTVVLTSQPTSAVTVSVTRSGDDDITVNKPSLTFTASNWNTAQTVTVNATEDTDAATGTATIAHGVTSSGDYSGETASSVSVTERDNDSASTTVTLRVSPDEVSENNTGQVVTVTGTLNGGTRGDATTVSVTVGSGTATPGTDFAPVGAITLTIGANQTSGTATFTLSPVNDAIDESDETVTVSGTTSITGLSVAGTEVTITDDDERGVTVTPTILTIDEGGSEEYTVVLTSQPTAAVTVSVTRSGDDDITVNKASLIFTTSNWDAAQTVMVSAAEDDDAVHGTATITHSVSSSGDYSGETASPVSVTERDNDSASTIVTLRVSPDEVSESSSSQVVTVTGTLNGGTRANETTVSVSIGSGTATSVTDFATVGAITLTIAANQASGEATFTLSPVNDAIDENDETVSVSGTTDGLSVTPTEVTIEDDDDRGVTVTPTTLSVGEGGSEEYTVVLTSQPTAAVTVSVTKSGDDDITVNKTSLTFTASNWNTAQTVMVSAAEDDDAVHGTAMITHSVSSSGDYSGETASPVSVTERDNDSASTIVTLRVSPNEVSENSSSQVVTVTGTLNGGTRGDATIVSVSVSGGTASSTDFAPVGAITLTIGANQTSGTAIFTLSPVNDEIDESDETVTVSGTTTAIGLSITSTQVTIEDDDTRGVTVTPTTLSVGEDESEEYTVVLTSQPTAAVTVSVAKSGDSDITVNKFSLTFTASNWNTAQTVMVSAAEDDDAAAGTATITHGVTSSGDYSGETASSVNVTERDNDSASTIVTLRVSPNEVSENSSSQVVTVTGTLNGGTRGDATIVSVSVSGGTASSTDFAPVGAITLTIAANQASGEATFTLSPVNDEIDEDNETVSVSGTTTAIGLSITSTQMTIEDDDTRGVTVTPTILTIDEGGSEEYTVVLTSQPTTAVTVSVTRSGDDDITVNKASLTFTTSNWDAAQTVTVSAAEDDDAAAGTATITHSVTSSGDYSGETASPVSVTERDNDSASTIVTLRVSPDEVSENSSSQVVTVTGTLNGGTRGDATIVSVSVSGGTASSTDFAPVGAITLTIGANQASGTAIFTLSPVNDAIDENDETVSVSGMTSGLSVTPTEVTIEDDDDRGVTVTPPTLSVGEDESEEYTVVLTSQPTAAVTVSVTRSGDSDIAVNKASLTFTASNWNTAQTVMVSAAEDDDAAAGTATITHGVTSSGDYSSETASPVSVTERDNDSASTIVTLRVSPDEVSESSSSQVVTVTGTLNGGTRANETTVSVSIGSGTATSGIDFAPVGAITLTIAANQASGTATFTLSPVNDAIDENNETVSVSGTTDGLSVTPTEVTIEDDDDRGVTVTPTTFSVGEGESEEYTVVLTSQPTAAVTVSVTRSGDDDITVNKASLTFTASNWNTAQTVMVSAAEDDDAAAGTATITHSVSSSGDYSSETASPVSVTERDNDSASTTVTLRVSPDEVSESSSSQVVTVTGTLNGGTRGDATTVSISIGSGTAISGTDFAAVGAITLTIAANQASGEATFTLSPVNDAIDEDNETVSVRGTTTATGLGITSTQVTIEDDDTRGVTVTPTILTIDEGGSEEYTVVLTSQPTAAVTVSVTRSGDDDITVNKSSLTFTASNWNTAQTVTVSAAEDDDAVHGTATITHSVTSSGDYSGETASPVSVTERDNDSASTTVTLRVSPDEVSENSSGLVVTVTGTLNGGTRADETTVSVSIGSGTATPGTDFAPVGAITLTIAANQASGEATFTLSPVNDEIDEDNETVSVSGTTTAIGLSITSTQMTIEDDDTRGVTVTPTILTIDEGGSEEYTVVLTSQPTAAVTVSVTRSGDDDIAVNKSSLTFTASNWNTAQTVMVSAAEDDDAVHGTATITHSVTSSGDYSGETASSVSVTERDNDSASTIVTLRVSPDEVSENSSSQIVTVTGTLNGGTRGDATIVSVSVSGGTASSTDFAPVGAITLTIAANQASGEATFTLSPVNDAIDENDETVSVSGMTSGLNVTPTEVTIEDDDDRGVTVTPTILTVDEGGSEEYTVVLTSQPTAAVTVSVTRSGDDDITVNKTSLTFTASNWNTAQTVTVNAAEDGDAAAGTATITHSVSSSSDYSGETASPVSVTERDNDSASTTVTLRVSPDEVSESSSSQVVTVTGTLNGGTRANETTVSVSIGSGTATSGTDFAIVGAITLTIGANQASGTATFTLSPVNDTIDESDETVSVRGTTTATGLGITSTQMTIRDDDTRGVTVTPTTLSVGEGDSEEYTVVLTSQPTAAVTVSVTRSGDSDITVNKASLTFTASNWDAAQTVMVSAAEDDDAVHGTATIAHGVTSSGDYSGETASSVNVTERDNDSASTTVTLRVSPGEVSENSSGQVVTVTGTLNGGTRANETTVSVSVGSGTATSVTDFAAVDAITLTIAANQASGEATFTLSPMNDAIDEDNETVSVSGTTSVTGLSITSTQMTIRDDDTRGVTVTPTILTIDEGGSEEYTVVLTSQPTSAVTVSVTRSGDDDITVNKPSLTFTASNWNTAQTVTVSAVEDDDAVHGTATITHSVTSSGDYSGETASPVSVTERDKDSASTIVTLRVSPDEVSESSSGQVVTVTGTLNGGTRGDETTVSVSVSGGTASSTDFAPVGAITLTIAANQTSGTAIFTLSPVNDEIDENDETVSVSGTTDGLSVTPTEVTIEDDDDRGVTVTPTTLSVGEDESEEYTVVLTSQPTASVTVTVGGTSGDVTVDKSSLTFTASNWNTAQTVTVNAAEDTDAVVDDPVSLTHTVSGGDYTGESADGVTVSVRENDSVSRSLTLTFEAPAHNDVDASGDVTLGDVLTYTATATNSGNVPLTNVVVKDLLVNTTGNTCGSVAIGGTCVLTGTYTVSQADVDAGKVDNTATGTADGVTDQSASQTTGVAQTQSLGLTITPSVSSFARINATISYIYTVRNSGTVTLSGPLSISDNKVSGITCGSVPSGGLGPAGEVTCEGSYTTVQADVDANGVTNVATATLGSVSSDAVTVTVPWKGPAESNQLPSVTISGVRFSEDGGSLGFIVSLSSASLQRVEVGYATSDGTATSGSDYTAISDGTLRFAPSSLSETITVAIIDDKIAELDETVIVTLSAPNNATLGTLHTATGTITDNDTRGVSVTPTILTIDEGGSEEYTVVLTSQPTAAVTVSVTRSGDDDITVNKVVLDIHSIQLEHSTDSDGQCSSRRRCSNRHSDHRTWCDK